MESSTPARILVLTESSAITPALTNAVRERAEQGPAQFRLVVPNPAPAEWNLVHPERHRLAEEAERVLEEALPALEEAAGHSIIGSVSIRHDPMDAIEERLYDEPFDEIIIVTRPHDLQRRLHVDLPHRLAHFGLPVTSVVEQPQSVVEPG
jgi:hypothetical protein